MEAFVGPRPRAFLRRHGPCASPPSTGEDVAEILRRMGKRSRSRRAELRGLRLRHLPRARLAHPLGARRIGDVPPPFTIDQLRRAVTELAVSHDQLASHAAGADALRAPREHGAARRGNRPRGEQPARRRPPLRPPPPRRDPEGSPVRDDLETDRFARRTAARRSYRDSSNFARQNKVSQSDVPVDELVEQTHPGIVRPEGGRGRGRARGAGSRRRAGPRPDRPGAREPRPQRLEAMPRGGTVVVRTGSGGRLARPLGRRHAAPASRRRTSPRSSSPSSRRSRSARERVWACR